LKWEKYHKRVAEGEMLVLVEGAIRDALELWEEHHGGKAMITTKLGERATALFSGGVYKHSNAAKNLLAKMRVAVLIGGMEVAERKPHAS
jgi:stearoyl-CoA desaturase (delta-9 desaturase)